MRKKYFLLIGLLLILTGGAFGFAKLMMDSLYAYQTPLPRVVNPGPFAGQKPITRRVVMVLIDGLRADQAENVQVMPALSALRAAGAWGQTHSQPPSFSQTGYSVIFTGAWPEWSGGPVMNLDNELIPVWPQETIISQVAANQQKSAVSGYYWFQKLIPPNQLSRSFFTPGEDARADKEVVAAALSWLKTPAEQFVLVHIDQVDYAGHHQGGPFSPDGIKAASQADQYVGQIVARLDLARDTIVVISDHGHVIQGGHGGSDADVLLEPFIFAGAGIKPGKYADIQMVDIAPTITTLLGDSLPGASMGRVLTDMLSWDSGNVPLITQAWSRQQAHLAQAYAAYLGETARAGSFALGAPALPIIVELRYDHILPERIVRSIIAGLLLALLLWGIMTLSGRDLRWMLLGTALLILLFHLRYALIDARGYSLSTWLGLDDSLIYSALTNAVGLLLVVPLLTWKLGWLKQAAFASASGVLRLAYAAAAFNLFPVLLYFALYGMQAAWYLPDMGWNYAALFFCLQALILGALGILLSALMLAVVWLLGKRRKTELPA